MAAKVSPAVRTAYSALHCSDSEEHGVGLEDERGVVAGFRTALLRKFHQLSGGFLFRFGDARLLGFNVLAGFFYDGGVGFLQEVERALRNAFRNAFSL